ncbi:MAG: hypothetical protein AAGE80_19890 [Pseudomonadota bacterium]
MKDGTKSYAIFWRVVLFGLLASILANMYQVAFAPIDNSFPFIPRYLLFQFLFSYQDLGFTRRSLIGTFLDFPNDTGFAWQIYIWCAAQYGALLVAMAYWLNRYRDPGLAWIVILSPATFLQLGFDYGRLDALLILVTGLCLMSSNRWTIAALPVMVMIHEGSIVMFGPLLVVSHFFRHGMTPALLGSVAASLILILWFAQNAQVLDRPIYELYTFLPDATEVLRLSFAENRSRVIAHYRDTWELMVQVPFFLALHLIALVYVVAVLLYAARRLQPGVRRVVLLAACCAPLLLTPLGADIGRWGAMTIFNLFLLIMAERRWAGETRAQHMTYLPPIRSAILILLFLSGPLAYGRPFPFARRLLVHIHLSAQ